MIRKIYSNTVPMSLRKPCNIRENYFIKLNSGAVNYQDLRKRLNLRFETREEKKENDRNHQNTYL